MDSMGFHGIPLHFKAFQGRSRGVLFGGTDPYTLPDLPLARRLPVVGSSGNSWHLPGVPRGVAPLRSWVKPRALKKAVIPE